MVELVTSAGNEDIFIAKYSGVNGAYQWARRFREHWQRICSGSCGRWQWRHSSGWVFSGGSNFGGGSLTSAGGSDIFIAKYDGANGAHQWSEAYWGYE